eukprot:CAMPEP_0172829632 /NCGR_PEP_ID=MMETSP1075-20121228/21658_1 /TAXON_ID=2916 /ORGANISM="Ceratium fusus, Strain PA161109" /LENGTH=112 /DNA_ID=CAMNT_0013671789 /DNA_START=181 /DNA_END=519 /DNA_ORIENTATION=+
MTYVPSSRRCRKTPRRQSAEPCGARASMGSPTAKRPCRPSATTVQGLSNISWVITTGGASCGNGVAKPVIAAASQHADRVAISAPATPVCAKRWVVEATKRPLIASLGSCNA